MTWLTTETAPHIDSFAAAEYHYNNFKPIRGRDIEETGAALGNRRDWGHKSLHKLDDHTYGFRLYNTDVVRIYRDNSIELDLSYPSLTTNKWAEHWLCSLVGRWINVNSEHNMISMAEDLVDDDTLKNYRLEVPDSEQRSRLYFFSDDDMFHIEPHYRKRWQKVFVKNPAPRYIKLVDKSGAHAARKPLQPFLNYLKMLVANPLPYEAAEEMRMESRKLYPEMWNSTEAYKTIVKQPDNDELWGYAAAWMHTSHYDWRVQGHVSELRTMRDIKTILYSHKYELDGLHGYKQLPIGVCKATQLYTQNYIDTLV